ncbi:hypothetical protein [Bacillus bombysepticus]|uniref:hypothetical protein n=1 Tax=Bacillus bombysepticus TaxID=658666 RepID=UPI0030177EFF
MKKNNLVVLDDINKMIKDIPSDVQSAMFMSGYVGRYETKAIENRDEALSDLREELKKIIDELPFDKLLSVYPTLLLLSISENRSKEIAALIAASYKQGYDDSLKENDSFDKGFQEGKSLRIKELKTMRKKI